MNGCIRFVPGFAAQARALALLLRPEEMGDVVERARRLGATTSFADGTAAWLRLSFFAGSLRYISDPFGTSDHWCSPRVTRFRGGGDCDDLAILVAALLRAGGVYAWVVTGELLTPRGREGHAWVEGHDELGGFFIEATTGKLVRHWRPHGYAAIARITPGRFELAA